MSHKTTTNFSRMIDRGQHLFSSPTATTRTGNAETFENRGQSIGLTDDISESMFPFLQADKEIVVLLTYKSYICRPPHTGGTTKKGESAQWCFSGVTLENHSLTLIPSPLIHG
eukprot:sb/3476979/